MTSDYYELLRLILNLIRFGIIADIDHGAQRARVLVGKNITNWRLWIAFRTGDAQIWLRNFLPTCSQCNSSLSPRTLCLSATVRLAKM